MFPKHALYCFKIFGIVPFTLKANKINQIKTGVNNLETFSKIDKVYSLLVTCLIVTLHYTGINYMHDTNYQGFLKENKLTTTIYHTLIAFGSSNILLALCYQQSEIVFILNKINAAKDSLKCAEAHTFKDKFFSYLSIVFFGHVCVLFIFVFYSFQRNSLKAQLFFLALGLSIFLVNSILMQYCMMLKVLKQMFKFINDNLKSILEKHNVSFGNLDFQNNSFVKQIDKLMNSYDSLNKLSQQVSDFYSFPMLWCGLIILMALINEIYNIMKEVIVLNFESKMFYPFALSHIYMNIISLSTLAIHVTNTIEEVL